MSANVDFGKVNEFQGLCGFSNLLRKENQALVGNPPLVDQCPAVDGDLMRPDRGFVVLAE